MTGARDLMEPAYASRTAKGGMFDIAGTVDPAEVTMLCWADPFRPDDVTPDHVRAAAVASLYGDGAHYTLPIGDAELRRELARHVGKLNGLEVDPDRNIIVCGGSDSALAFTMRPFLEPGRAQEVLVPTPSYANNFDLPPLLGGVSVPVPTHERDGYQLDIGEFEERCTSRTKMVLLTNPNNPTGTVYSEQCLRDLADLVRRRNLVLVVDQCFEQTVYDGYAMTSIAAMPTMLERTVLVGSLSKSMGLCGYRIGYVVASDDVTDVLHSCTVQHLGAPNTAAQAAAVAGLRDPGFVEGFRREFAVRADLACEILGDVPNIRFAKPQSGFLLWIDVSAYGGSEATTRYLLDHAAVLVGQGGSFGSEDHIRLVFGALADRERCLGAIRRVRDALLMHPASRRQS